MAKFITGAVLEEAITDIIWGAKQKLLIVSPFIKLDDYFIELFNNHTNNPNLHILVVFGKNEYDKSKSLNKTDFEFLKTFPNVSIVYVANLHAKYYGNESKGVITSINLYDHSFKNNIEFGVYSEGNLLDRLSNSNDMEAWKTCIEIANSGEPVFIKRPIFKKKLLTLLGKDYSGSKTLLDNTSTFFVKSEKQLTSKKLPDFVDELEFESAENDKPTRQSFSKIESKLPTSISNEETGYCIRTGVKIPFNPARPFSPDAYKS